MTSAASALALCAVPHLSLAETPVSLNFYGVPGLIDMPSAESLPDAQFSGTYMWIDQTSRATLGFQLTDRIGLAFRYSRINDWDPAASYAFYDRSLDIRMRVLDESRYLPAVTIGLQDFLGTGVYSSEYLVATKHFGERLKATVGLGWGRYGSDGEIFTTGTRPPENDVTTGGTIQYDQWFRGPAAPFYGIEWQATDKLTLKAERSSDLYRREAGELGHFERKNPYNFGAEYQLSQHFRLGAYYLYGNTFGLSAQVQLNPKRPSAPGTSAGAPFPVKPRTGDMGTSWTADAAQVAQVRRSTAEAMSNDGMLLESMSLSGTRATIRLRNSTYDSEPMALGRALRALTYTLPPSVEEITIVPVDLSGLPLSAITFRRSDIEAFENAPDGAEQMLARARISDAANVPAPQSDAFEGVYPRFSWSIQPTVSLSMFGGRDKLLGNAGIRARATYEVAPGLVLRGAVSQQLLSRYEGAESDSVLPRVRSEGIRYYQEGKTALEQLTASYYTRPGKDLYARLTVGYLERMFGGVSAELLWKPVDSRFALGAEVNWVQQRDFSGGLGFTDYSVATGHVSGYYNLDEDYLVAVHAGRYLAGDVGATFELSREFANGWRVGAYATLTDVSFDDFGEGSFDKGLTAEIPLSWLLGRPTRSTMPLDLKSLQRDGGQRLRVDGRLYGTVRDYHKQDLSKEWGLFWR